MSISLTILGSTGSVGENTLRVLKQKEHQQRFQIHALAACSQVEKLAEQCAVWRPAKVALGSLAAGERFKQLIQGKHQPKLLYGDEGLEELAADAETDWVVNALSGGSGLRPSFMALRHGKHLLLANKESLVSAGDLLMKMAQGNKGSIVPLDSEHNAILRCLPSDYRLGQNPREHSGLSRITLTASGGPFLDYEPQALKNVTPQQAIAHPIWNMGAKISVDSASMMNKGLEILEASILFALPEEYIRVLIHPQSIVHCLLEFCDRSAIAQLSLPDMKIVIHQALSYPDYQEYDYADPLRLDELTFREVNEKEFPCLELARHAARAKGALPAVMSEADETAVDAFLSESISFNEIPQIIEKVMEEFSRQPAPTSVDEVLELLQQSKTYALSILSKC